MTDQAPAPPTTPPPPTGSKEKRALIVTALGSVLILLYVVLYLLPTHHPRPNGLEVGVVGSPAQVQQLRGTLGAQDPGLSIREYASVDSASTAIRARKIYGAFDLEGSKAVLTAPAASYQVAQLLQQAGMAQQITRVQVLVPLPAGDSQGTALSNLVLPVLITSMLMALLASQLIPELRTWDRIVFTGLIALCAGFGAIGFAKAIDALNGNIFALSGWLTLGIMGMALCSMGLLRLLGQPGLFVAFFLFLLLGNPGSGLTSAPGLLPGPWSIFGDYLPPAALGSALRHTAYFDAHRTGGPLCILLGWLLAGILLNVVADLRTRTRTPAEATAVPTGQHAEAA